MSNALIQVRKFRVSAESSPLPGALAGSAHTMPSTTRQMTIPHLGFVGGLLYAVRKAGRAPPPEPPDHLRCPISCDLYDDPVLLSQTGHTYDRVSIERWLRQKSPPTDPASNVELHSTATVPNWALRDAVNEWRAQNGNAPLQAPECATRRLAGGANARDGLSVGFAGVSLPGFGLNNVWAHGTNTVLGGTPQNVAFALRPVRLALLGVLLALTQLVSSVVAAVFACAESSASFFLRVAGAPPHAAAHVAALGALACCCAATASGIALVEGLVVRGTQGYFIPSEMVPLIAPAQNALWWAGVFSAVWFANGGFVDPIRADAIAAEKAKCADESLSTVKKGRAKAMLKILESEDPQARAAAPRARRAARIIHSWTKRTRGKTGGGTGGCGCSRRCSGRGACGTGTEGRGRWGGGGTRRRGDGCSGVFFYFVFLSFDEITSGKRKTTIRFCVRWRGSRPRHFRRTPTL